VGLLYAFLVFVSLMGAAFKLLGSGFSETLIATTANPVVGLMVGMLSTAIIQSSSTTTSMIVGLVAAGGLSVRGAIPMVMGANIGTTVTNTLVAMAAINRREEFRRSFAGATMHDFFNVLSLLILLPIELTTHTLERAATSATRLLLGTSEVEFTSPVKAITKPVVKFFMHQLETAGLPESAAGMLALVVALGGIILALARLPKIMKSLFLSRAEGPLYRHLRRGGIVGMALGTVLTVLVQSSSITTSLLVPLIGAGILSLEGAFAITLGANVGTTVTALLASTQGTQSAVTIALVHVLFNVCGIAIIYPLRPVRHIPIRMARWLADRSITVRATPIIYLLTLFFLLPGIIILGQRLLGGN
jgi:sodium-dependent phosphate cotransporter